MTIGTCLVIVLVMGFWMWAAYRAGYANGQFDTMMEDANERIDRLKESSKKPANLTREKS